jgi:hypothetical protein
MIQLRAPEAWAVRIEKLIHLGCKQLTGQTIGT